MKKLQHRMSARRDLRTYLVLAFGLAFAYAGATLDPAANCDASGRQCAPWLVYAAFGIGVLALAAGVGLFGANRRWGSRLDLEQRRLFWWDNAMIPAQGDFSLDDIARIKVQRPGESNDRIFFYGRDGERLRFPDQRALPYDLSQWARDLADHCPHIALEIEEG